MTNKEIIEKLYSDFSQGNIPEVLNAMSEKITIETPGPGIIPWSGVHKGKHAAMDFFQRVGNSTTYEKFEAQEFIQEGENVVAIGIAHFTTKPTGKKGISPWIMSWKVQNGKAIYVKNFWDTYVVSETMK